MKAIKLEWYQNITSDEPAIFYFFADTHIGNKNTNKKLLQQHISKCWVDGATWFHLGDWCEYITPKDKRWNINERAPDTIDQTLEVVDLFSPIEYSCGGVLAGNHEAVISSTYGDIMKSITKGLGIENKYLGYEGFVSVRLPVTSTQKKGYLFYLHHGHGMGSTIGSKANNLHRMSHKFDADIYVIGHIHTYQHMIDDVIGVKTTAVRRPRLVKNSRHYISCPSYIDPYINGDTNYATQKALQPQPLGCVRMEIGFKRWQGEREWYVKIEPVIG